MIDMTTKKPLCVANDGTAGPYIMVPYRQLADICKLLDGHGIRYWAEEHVISFDGGPESAVINFGRGADASAIQAVLDRAQ
jgi:hypothetical protein